MAGVPPGTDGPFGTLQAKRSFAKSSRSERRDCGISGAIAKRGGVAPAPQACGGPRYSIFPSTRPRPRFPRTQTFNQGELNAVSNAMYDHTIPVFVKMLGNLSAILDKAAKHCEAKKIDPNALLGARLFPDMFPLTRQVQVATDQAKGGAARLAGVDVPKYDDGEKSFDDLKARIAKTIAFVNGIKPEQVANSAGRDITLPIGGNPVTFKGEWYAKHFVLPNLYFHVTTAYTIHRHKGVELGKRDFIGGRD